MRSSTLERRRSILPLIQQGYSIDDIVIALGASKRIIKKDLELLYLFWGYYSLPFYLRKDGANYEVLNAAYRPLNTARYEEPRDPVEKSIRYQVDEDLPLTLTQELDGEAEVYEHWHYDESPYAKLSKGLDLLSKVTAIQ